MQVPTLLSPDLAHKVEARNLWLLNAQPVGDARLAFNYRIPDWGPSPRLTDLIEVQRQACTAFCHISLHVPLTDVSMMSRVSIAIDSKMGLTTAIPRIGTVIVGADEVTRKAGRISAVSLSAQFLADEEQPFGVGVVAGSFLPTSIYERVRAMQPHGLMRITREQRELCEAVNNVGRDPEDPVFADHDSDHISGMTVVATVEREVRGLRNDHAVQAIQVDFFSYLNIESASHLVLNTDQLQFEGFVEQGGLCCAQVRGALVQLPPQGSPDR